MSFEFPAFLKLYYDDDGSAKSAFIRGVNGLLDTAENRFKEFSGEAQRLVDSALSAPRNASGSLDLGVADLHAAAAAEQARAIAAREAWQATKLAAQAAGDESEKSRLAVAALEALAVEYRQSAAAAMSHAEAVEQVQAQLNKTASATDMVVAAGRRGTSQFGAVTNSVRAQRVAFVQLGQQMTDVVVQAQMGAKWPTIFVQQVPQMAFALSGLDGKVGSLARTLSGPLGAGFIAVTALAIPFISKMLEGDEASDKLKSSTVDLSSALDRHRASQEELNKAIDDYNQKQAQANTQTQLYTRLALDAAKADLAAALAIRQKLKADQEWALAHPSLAVSSETSVADVVGSIQSRMTGNDAEIARLQNEINGRLLDMGKLEAAALDPLEAIRRKYADINEELKNIVAHNNAGAYVKGVGMVGGTIKNGRFTGQIPGVGPGTFNNVPLQDVVRAVGAAQRAAEASERAAQKITGGNAEASLGDMVALVKQLFPGATITSTTNHSKFTDRGTISDHWSGPGHPPRAIDFVPAGGMGSLTKDEVRARLENAGVDIRRNSAGVEQIFGPGDRGHSDHFHFAWQGAAPDPEKVKEAFAKAQKALQDYSDRAGESIARINERFDKQPRLIDQAAAATRQLDAVIADLQEKKPPNFQTLIAQAEEAKATIQDALVRPFQEMARDSERRQQIDDLILAGQDEQAQALQEIWRLESQIGDLLPEQRAEVERIVKAEYEHGKALERAHELQSAFLDATRSVRDEIERIIAGEGKFSDFKNIFKQLNAKFLTEKIFGGALRDLDQWVKENTGIKDSVDYLREQTHDAGEAALKFADTLNQATNRVATGGAGGLLGGSGNVAASTPADLAALFDSILPPLSSKAVPGVPGTGPAANDNGEIVVTARKTANGIAGMTPDRYFQVMSARIVAPITDALANLVGPKLAGTLGGVMSGALYGYSTGGAVGGVLGGVKGLVDDLGGANGGLSKALGGALKGAQTGTMVAGLGKALGIKLSSTGAQIGGAIGSVLPIPGGEIIGSIAGGIIGKLFGGTKSGRVTLNGTSQTIGGTDKKLQAAAGQTGGDFVSTLQSVAQQLGGQLGSYGTITIGQRNGSFRVNVGGSGTGSLKTSHGARDFGEDQQAAIAYALQQAIVNGAVKGISAGAQRLLAAGTDLQAQLQKALDFQGVFTELKSYLDPVGAALDTLDARFSHLKDIFAEAGASAEDYAKLQQLYGIERTKAVADAMNQVGGALKSLLSDLTTGDMGLSLRDREKTAQANYDALATRVRAGDTTAFDDFAEAARTLLDIERQIHGSQSDYFATFDNVRDLTKTTLDAQQALADAAANRDSPFAGSASGAPTNDNQGVIDGIDRLGDTLINALGPRLDAVNTNLGALIGNQIGPTDRNPLATKFAGFW